MIACWHTPRLRSTIGLCGLEKSGCHLTELARHEGGHKHHGLAGTAALPRAPLPRLFAVTEVAIFGRIVQQPLRPAVAAAELEHAVEPDRIDVTAAEKAVGRIEQL